LKDFLNKSAITKMQAAIVAIIVIAAAIIGAVYYVTLPGPSPSASTSPSPSPSASPIARLVRIGNSWPCYIDPAIGADFCSQAAQTNLYDPLVWPTPGGGVIPWIASNWTISDDGLNYTFSIRKDVKFHSGGNLTANDVAFTMHRLQTIGQGYSWVFAPYINNVTGVTVVDPYTIMFHLNKRLGPFLNALVRLYIVENATVMANIVTPGTYGAFGDYATTWLTTHDAGSGPYKISSVSLQDYVDMVKFNGYWYPAGFDAKAPTELKFLPTAANTATQKTLMLNKELEVSDEWQSQEFLDSFNTTNYIHTKSHGDVGEYYYMLNTQKKPTDDIHIRKALAYAFDYATVMSTIYQRYDQSKSVVPMILPGAVDCQIYKFNLTMASAEVNQSIYYPDIVNHPENYVIDFIVMPEVPERFSDAAVLAEQAAKVGLNVKVTSVPWTQFVERMSKLDSSPNIAPIVVDPLYVDAGSLLEMRYSSASMGTFNNGEWLANATLDAEIEDALGTQDTTARLAKYGTIQREIMSMCPTIVVYDFKVVEAVQDYVKIPQFEDPSTVVGIQGYNVVCRTWQVTPPS
jgi:peptide/nickel transport system substrate-binding protein